MRKDVMHLFYTICEKVNNDPDGSHSWLKHFEYEVSSFVDKETKSWRSAHEEAMKNIGSLGSEVNRLSSKNKAR